MCGSLPGAILRAEGSLAAVNVDRHTQARRPASHNGAIRMPFFAPFPSPAPRGGLCPCGGQDRR